MKPRIYIPLLLATLGLVSCEKYDVPAGHARVTRFSTPAPVVKKQEPRPVIAQQQPAPQAPKVKAPEQPQLYYIASQPEPKPENAARHERYSAPANTSRLPIVPRRYPLMPGQSRGLKARGAY